MNSNLLRKSGLPAIIVLGIGCFCAVILLPIFQHRADNARRSQCQFILRDIVRACEMYVADSDGKYPPLAANGQGWSELVSLYSKKPLEFSCPAGENSNSLASDYFYNARLVGMQSEKILVPAYTITFCDGIDNGPTNSHLSAFPTHISPDGMTYATRHLQGINIAFADGHIMWFRLNRKVVAWKFDPLKEMIF